MLQALIGQKIDQTQKFLENGKRVSVTEVAVRDNVVVQVKTAETDKYSAVQLGWGTKKNPTKPALGHGKKAKLQTIPLVLKEVQLQKGATAPEVGTLITVETIFKPGDIVSVSGVSKGKGFASGIKRYNFRGGPKTHGQSDRHRAPGSIGQGTTPGRVYKGKKMAGHMGVESVTIQNLTIMDVDSVNKKLYVLGLIPGTKKSTVVLTLTGEMKKFVPLLSTKEEEVVPEVTAPEEAVATPAVQESPAAPVEEAPKAEEAKEESAEEVKEEVAAESGEAEKAEVKEEAAPATEKENDGK